MVDIPQTIHSTPQSKLTSQSLFDDPEDENDNDADVTKLIDKVNEMYHDLVGDSSHSPGVMESRKRGKRERKKKEGKRERRKERKEEREKGGKERKEEREKGGKRERRKKRKEKNANAAVTDSHGISSVSLHKEQ